ncbi:hypothetical protein ARSEF4850_009893 [Beauveria asiatica]
MTGLAIRPALASALLLLLPALPVLSAATSLGSGAASMAVSGGLATCQNLTVTDNFLHANCLYDGDFRSTSIDLGLCLENDGGHLRGQKDGHYERSCDANKGEITDSREYSVECLDEAGFKVLAHIDLTFVLSNEDGHLSCYGHNGS